MNAKETQEALNAMVRRLRAPPRPYSDEAATACALTALCCADAGRLLGLDEVIDMTSALGEDNGEIRLGGLVISISEDGSQFVCRDGTPT